MRVKNRVLHQEEDARVSSNDTIRSEIKKKCVYVCVCVCVCV